MPISDNSDMSLWRTARQTLCSIEAIPLIALYTLLLLVVPFPKTNLPVSGHK